jgi:hypothetical protein
MISSETPRCWHSIRLDKSYEEHNFLLENSSEVLKTVKSLNLSIEIRNLLLQLDWSKKKVLIVDQVFFNEKIGLETIDMANLATVTIRLVSYRSPFTLPQSPRTLDGKYTKESLIIPIPRRFDLKSIQILKKTIKLPNIVEFSELTDSIRANFSEFFDIMGANRDVIEQIKTESKNRRLQEKKDHATRNLYSPSSKEKKFIQAICAFERIVKGQFVC